MKEEKGAATLFVTVAIFFFMVILIIGYMKQIRKVTTINEEIQQIQENYGITEEEMQEKYEEISK